MSDRYAPILSTGRNRESAVAKRGAKVLLEIASLEAAGRLTAGRLRE